MDLELFSEVLLQKRSDSNKTYSLHEPHVKCYTKGKEHKRFEFGSKVSILITQKTGVIVFRKYFIIQVDVYTTALSTPFECS